MSNTSPAKASGRPVADHVDPAKAEPVDPKTADVEAEKARDAELLKPVPGISDEEIDVKTSGEFALMDPQTAKHFGSEKATTTKQTQFVVENLANGRLVKA